MGLNKVLFEGNTYMVDTDKYKFIARDKNGSVCAYTDQPYIPRCFHGWVTAKGMSECILLERVGQVNWEESCQGVEGLIVNESKDVGVHPPFRYNGFMYENVAKDMKWIATDLSGRVYAYDCHPVQSMIHKHWYDSHQSGECELLAVERYFLPWTGSLLEIAEILKHEK